MLKRYKMEFQIKTNPDREHYLKINNAVKKNKGYCPCKLEKEPENFCICDEFKNQNDYGFCHCKQYYKVLKTKTVCLCGSTRFKDVFFKVARDLTMQGYIVTMPFIFSHVDGEPSDEDKTFLDQLHKAKIAQADIVYIINYSGYIGDSTREEIEWAQELNKEIQYLEKI